MVSATKAVKGILFGQCLSLLITGTGIFSTYLADDYGVNAPTTQSFLNYALLALFCGVLIFRGTFLATVRDFYGWYLLLAILDVEANYFVVKAYQFTSITSIMLLDCVTIPVTMALSYFLLARPVHPMHVVGAGICVCGIVLLVLADAVSVQDDESAGAAAKNPLLGDAYVLLGASLYACSNVGQEHTVVTRSRTEYLALLGLFGFVISGFQLALLEHEELRTITWSPAVVLLFLGFAACLVTLYVFAPTMMLLSSAVVFNLSLLTSDFYSAVVAVFLFDQRFSALYLGGFLVIVVGIIVYHLDDVCAKYGWALCQRAEVEQIADTDDEDQLLEDHPGGIELAEQHGKLHPG
mmetsp:Transcript_25034/g.70059  ORF Transcript_25034/g.70059 Transcript_25034/m.70059 type:complete len:352 (-) Transcript_25034:81-1136(-)|eukprot:CAMPEP_0119128488 /NCGR_PEP_ID=MMETSP1310-20130426/6625_1 /TAXON_ID=464262 /ORGANISM="Genus nov. species nov., Strain RCC2339" /LENGTH=351 /DNA_ID=CAMNT_0007118833 /DNA_START=55 /DNA_END=1110 /DNA_ORIENTATION=+